jgi:hypothetical protein
MMRNSTRSGAAKDVPGGEKAPNARDADRTGKAGDAVERKPLKA